MIIKMTIPPGNTGSKSKTDNDDNDKPFASDAV
jgi:hypothetical protein